MPLAVEYVFKNRLADLQAHRNAAAVVEDMADFPQRECKVIRLLGGKSIVEYVAEFLVVKIAANAVAGQATGRRTIRSGEDK